MWVLVALLACLTGLAGLISIIVPLRFIGITSRLIGLMVVGASFVAFVVAGSQLPSSHGDGAGDKTKSTSVHAGDRKNDIADRKPGIFNDNTLGLHWDIEHSSWIAPEDRELFRAAAVKVLLDDENCKTIDIGGKDATNPVNPYFLTCNVATGRPYSVLFNRADLSAHAPLRGNDATEQNQPETTDERATRSACQKAVTESDFSSLPQEARASLRHTTVDFCVAMERRSARLVEYKRRYLPSASYNQCKTRSHSYADMDECLDRVALNLPRGSVPGAWRLQGVSPERIFWSFSECKSASVWGNDGKGAGECVSN